MASEDSALQPPFPSATTGKKEEEETSIRLVVQRYRQARLLVDDTDVVTAGFVNDDDVGSRLTHPNTDGSTGLLVYVSFAKSASKEKVHQAAKALMNLPVLTVGAWGDGTEPRSVLDLAEQGEKEADARVSIMLVPLANLISKVKSQGKSIQYHRQIDKTAGKALYDYFVECTRAFALEHQLKTRNDKVVPKWLTDIVNASSSNKTDASIPPDQIFRDATLYSSWDEAGMPLTNRNGEALTKSAVKKLRKLHDAHKKRHEKCMTKNASVEQTNAGEKALVVDQDKWCELDSSFLQVVAGTFGKRQGLELISDMGPFCHVLNL